MASEYWISWDTFYLFFFGLYDWNFFTLPTFLCVFQRRRRRCRFSFRHLTAITFYKLMWINSMETRHIRVRVCVVSICILVVCDGVCINELRVSVYVGVFGIKSRVFFSCASPTQWCKIGAIFLTPVRKIRAHANADFLRSSFIFFSRFSTHTHTHTKLLFCSDHCVIVDGFKMT